MQTRAIGTVANSLPENEVILLTLLISKGYIPYTDLRKISGKISKIQHINAINLPAVRLLAELFGIPEQLHVLPVRIFIITLVSSVRSVVNLFNHTARIAHCHAVGGNGAGYHATCPDDAVPADSDSRQQDGSSPNPHAVLYPDGQSVCAADFFAFAPIPHHAFVYFSGMRAV